MRSPAFARASSDSCAAFSSIRRRGSAVILEPLAEDWAWLDQVVGDLDEDFERAATEDVKAQERPELDYFS